LQKNNWALSKLERIASSIVASYFGFGVLATKIRNGLSDLLYQQ